MNGPGEGRELTCDEVRDMAGAFVLGALDASDEAALRDHLATCPETHAEIGELGGVLPVFAESVPVVEPPDSLKGRIMAAAAADLEAGPVGGVATATPESASSEAGPREAASSAAPSTPPGQTAFPSATEGTARRSRTSTGTWVLRIAAVVAIVALGGWNLLLQGRLDASQTYEQAVAQVLTVAGQPGSLTAVLTGEGGTGSGLAAITASGQATLAMQGLAPTSGATVYEAWAIVGTGAPVPLGSFTVGRGGTAAFGAGGVPSSNQVVLALTLEPGPGATTPTMPIISKGVATAT